MENASKALIMAGGILIALLTIGALVFMFNNISEVEKQKNQNAEIDAVLEFNRQFEAFDMAGLRGTDILTVINKMINYNKSNDVQVEEYEPMTMSIKFTVDEDSASPFYKGRTKKLEGDNTGDLGNWFEYNAQGSNKIQASSQGSAAGLDAEKVTEFKRKYFRCTDVQYDNDTGRVIRMEFTEIDVK